MVAIVVPGEADGVLYAQESVSTTLRTSKSSSLINPLQALEPPLRTGITPAPGRPRSWRVRTTAPPWGAGPTSVKDFTARDPRSVSTHFFRQPERSRSCSPFCHSCGRPTSPPAPFRYIAILSVRPSTRMSLRSWTCARRACCTYGSCLQFMRRATL